MFQCYATIACRTPTADCTPSPGSIRQLTDCETLVADMWLTLYRKATLRRKGTYGFPLVMPPIAPESIDIGPGTNFRLG